MRRRTRPDKGNVLQLRPTAKIIYNAFYEWRFGAYDDHIYFIFNDEASHFGKLHRVERHASRYFGHSGIARGYKQTVQFFRSARFSTPMRVRGLRYPEVEYS